MTRIEKILMAVLILAIIATAVFWKDVQSIFGVKRENIADDESKEKKDKKDKKDKDDDDKDKKKKDNKDEVHKSFFLSPAKKVG